MVGFISSSFAGAESFCKVTNANSRTLIAQSMSKISDVSTYFKNKSKQNSLAIINSDKMAMPRSI